LDLFEIAYNFLIFWIFWRFFVYKERGVSLLFQDFSVDLAQILENSSQKNWEKVLKFGTKIEKQSESVLMF